jgi:hypothetical protein
MTSEALPYVTQAPLVASPRRAVFCKKTCSLHRCNRWRRNLRCVRKCT